MKKLSLLSALLSTTIFGYSQLHDYDNEGAIFSNSSGNVGIGINPSNFHPANNQLVIGSGVGHNGITIFAQNNSQSRIMFSDINSTATPALISYNHALNEFRFRVNNTDKMFLRSNGNLDLTAGNLDVNGTISANSSLQNSYNINSVTGNGVRFWNSDAFKVHMGNGFEYWYGPVSNYSIKSNMNATTGRGWTWGANGQTPIAALSNIGEFQIAGDFYSLGKVGIGITNPAEALQIGDRWTFHDGGSKVIGYNFDYDGGAKRLLQDEVSYLGFTATGNIEFKTAASGAAGSAITWNIPLNIKNNGYVGIGTTDPGAELEVMGMVKFDGDNNEDEIIFKSNPGHRSIDFHKLVFHEWSHGNVLSISDGKVGIWNTSPAQALDVVGAIQSTTAAANDALVVKNSGSNGIDFKVKGDGRVFAREVKVTIDNFPDYVFAKDYQLMSLDDLRQYIDRESHLPGIQSAEVIDKEGIGLGELSKIQMEKIEELTLYILQLEERIKELEEQ